MLAANLYETVSDDRRVIHRPALERDGTIRAGEMARPIAVRDLTRDGCRIAASARFAVDDVVSIGIGGVGITQARIAWMDGDSYGCAFVEPLRPGRVTAAFEASNLVAFPTSDDRAWASTATNDPVRWSRPMTAAFVLGGGLLCWAAIGVAALALI